MAEPNQLPPVDDATDSSVRLKSESPQVRAERARWEAIVHAVGLLLGAVTDWIGIGAVCYLAPLQHWETSVTVGAVLGLAGGTIIAKMRGQAAGSTSAALMTLPTAKVVSALVAAASRHVAMLLVAMLLVLAVALGGCASLPSVAPAHAALVKVTSGMQRMGAGIAAACLPEPTPAWCADTKAAYSETQAGVAIVDRFVTAYESVAP